MGLHSVASVCGVYTQNYEVFGLCPSPGVLKNTREQNVSETESVSVLRLLGGRHLLCWFR
jgi:hypothetical protein